MVSYGRFYKFFCDQYVRLGNVRLGHFFGYLKTFLLFTVRESKFRGATRSKDFALQQGLWQFSGLTMVLKIQPPEFQPPILKKHRLCNLQQLVRSKSQKIFQRNSNLNKNNSKRGRYEMIHSSLHVLFLAINKNSE